MNAGRLGRLLGSLLVADVLAIVVSGGRSLLLPFGEDVAAPGFAWRLAGLGTLLALRLRVALRDPAGLMAGRLVLALLLLPTLLQFQYAGGRINGDGLMYYPYVRSLWKDFDIEFTNEYTHYGLIERGDLAIPTQTGHRRSIFSIGPALVWTPFFWLGEAAARLHALAGADVDFSGYGPHHRNAVALGSLLYGFAAVLLVHGVLFRHFGAGLALLSATLTWWATFLHWYMVQQPTMSHASSAFAAALAIALWDRTRGRRGAGGFFALGLALGLAMCIRWQNGVLLLLPALELLERCWLGCVPLSRAAGWGGLTLLGTGLAVFPQLAAWKTLYDEWLLTTPPHGADFLRLAHPFVLNTLFSSRHGLLSWTPVLWLGFLGFWPLLRHRRQLALPLLAPLLLMTYVNMCSGDWWAGGSFSNRRFDSLLPILAVGLAASLAALRVRLERQPGWALAALAAPLLTWNLALTEQQRQGRLEPDQPVAFARLAEGNAFAVASLLGSPQTWPASWLFAWRFDAPASQYDHVVGRYLFYRQNNLGGRIDVGGPDDVMLAEGWGGLERRGDRRGRRVVGRARLFAPLDVPRALGVVVVGAAETGTRVGLSVNGTFAGEAEAPQGALAEWRFETPASLWRREVNSVELNAPGLFVDAVGFDAGEGQRRRGSRP